MAVVSEDRDKRNRPAREPDGNQQCNPLRKVLQPFTMKPSTGTIILVVTFLVVFGIELASHSAGNEASLLKLGALPDSGELHGQYWRLGIYSFLHLNGTHLLS